METLDKLTLIENYLRTIPQPCHTVTNEYNGMQLTEFRNRFNDINIVYLYKEDKTHYIIELKEKDKLTACEMVNNICVNGYIFNHA